MKKPMICLFAALIAQQVTAQNLKKEWIKVLQGCNASQTFGKETLFFGPSNNIGVGSVWRKTEDKAYNPRFELSDMIPDPKQRATVIKLGVATNQCSTDKDNAWESTINVPFLGPIYKLTGLGVYFHKARKTTVSVDSLAVDVIKEVPFEQLIANLAKSDPKNPYVLDIYNNPGRLVVTKAYRLTGLSVKLDFDPKDVDSLKSKYPNGGTITLGGDSALKVDLSFKSNSEVTLKLPAQVYIAGEFSKLTTSGTINLNNGANLDVALVKVKTDPEATVGLIEPVKKE